MCRWKELVGWQYLSHRVFILWIAFLCAFAVDLIWKINVLQHGLIGMPTLVLTAIFDVSALALGWKKVYKPYHQIERMAFRYLEGYLADYTDSALPHLSPASEKELMHLDKMLHSPEAFDINKRHAQYLALQNQINPHFLYNTLESIRSEAVIAGLDSVSEMTESLASFFRYTISKVENLVSVEEELENCKTYFRIQQYRFGNRLALHIDYDAVDWQAIRYYRMPKLTLQPILENSIIHGTELKLGTSHLTIHFTCTEKRLIIRVSDDGVGMNSETLAKLNHRLYHNTTEHQQGRGGIALTNVNHRIHLLFGEEYGMHIYSIEGVGTDVEISIPVVVSDLDVKHREVFQ